MSGISKLRFAAHLFEYFYVVHYQVNMVLEDVMRGSLTRKEVALLFLLFAEGGTHSALPRKLVVERLAGWFDATSSNVTKIITRLAATSPGLVAVGKLPGSARDKRISLTPKGRTLIQAILARGESYSTTLLEGVSEAQMRAGIEFFRAASGFTNTLLSLTKLQLHDRDPKQ